jgi:hypothetical protein
MSTIFLDPTHLVHTNARTPDFLRSAVRNERVDGCVIANRSNYTRVTFDNSRSAAFIIPVGPYSVRVRATPDCGGTANFVGLKDERLGMALSASEMRAMAYGLLAAANWIDSRDNDAKQRTRRPQQVTL